MTKTKKAAAPAKAKTKKPAKPATPRATIGHNSNGEVIPGLVTLVQEYLHIEEQRKALSKSGRDVRNQAKTEFGILSSVWNEEIKKQKMDGDVRVQYESGQEDIKRALGYQAELDFVDGKPTKASASQQRSEEELRQFGEEQGEGDADADSDDQGEQSETDKLEPPAFLKRTPGRIEREG